jgi:hypothetical protein
MCQRRGCSTAEQQQRAGELRTGRVSAKAGTRGKAVWEWRSGKGQAVWKWRSEEEGATSRKVSYFKNIILTYVFGMAGGNADDTCNLVHRGRPHPGRPGTSSGGGGVAWLQSLHHGPVRFRPPAFLPFCPLCPLRVLSLSRARALSLTLSLPLPPSHSLSLSLAIPLPSSLALSLSLSAALQHGPVTWLCCAVAHLHRCCRASRSRCV